MPLNTPENNPPTVEKIITSDGSITLKSAQFGVTYHSAFGALEESLTVFISAGLDYAVDQQKKSRIQVLEVGFGTGFNAILTYHFALQRGLQINYLGIEAYPIAIDIVGELNYPALLGDETLINPLLQMHKTPDATLNQLADHFSFQIKRDLLQNIQLQQEYDLIYFDAFAPSAQPELWTSEVTDQMFNALVPGGVLTTYGAQGQFRRNLKASGFIIEKLPGYSHKREMTRAFKP